MEYTNLEVWKLSRELVTEIYSVTKSFPSEEMYGLTNQIRRCAISVPSNIAEGCGRQSNKETIRFLYIARGSMYELETQMYLSKDLGFINQLRLDVLLEKITSCKKLLNGFIRYYANKE